MRQVVVRLDHTVTIHYHGTPITPMAELYSTAGAHFCVSHWRPDQIRQCHEIGQSVMIDNGAFSAWKAKKPILDWSPYYPFCDKWLDCPTTWAVIPDVIKGGEEENDALISQWPHGDRGVPVWHLHESIDRLTRLADEWPRVCMGSSEDYKDVLSPIWERRMDTAWRALGRHHRRTPYIHMLRGMQLVRGHRWPFASVDSTDIARNHSANQNAAAKMLRSWDAAQCPSTFTCRGEQLEWVA